jgi:hypothetical protein
MKNKLNFKHVIRIILIMTGIALLQSCAVYGPNTAQMVTVPDIIQMSKDGVSSKDIIRDIRNSHTVYGLKADQLAKLRDQGVQDSVINYMGKTKIDAIRQNQWRQDSNYWWPGFNGYLYGGLGFGWPFYGGLWGWNWGPAIVFSNHGGGFYGGFRGESGYRGGFNGGGRRR